MLESASRTPSTSRPFASFSTANRVRPSSVCGGDHDQIGRRALDDELLAARTGGSRCPTARPASRSPRAGASAPSSMASAATVSPARMPGRPALAQRRALQRLDDRHRGDQEGRGREVAADLLEHDARLDMAEAEAAIGLVDQDAGEAQLGELLPQRVAEAVARSRCRDICAAACAIAPSLGHEVARRVAQHGLVFGEVERHFVLRTNSSSPAKAGIESDSSPAPILTDAGDVPLSLE